MIDSGSEIWISNKRYLGLDLWISMVWWIQIFQNAVFGIVTVSDVHEYDPPRAMQSYLVDNVKTAVISRASFAVNIMKLIISFIIISRAALAHSFL